MVNPENFKPGVPAIVEVRGYPNIKFQSFFRGCKSNQFLLMDHPSREGRLLSVQEGTQCIIRFINDGKIVGFRSSVITTIRVPGPLMFINFPESVETSKLRTAERYPVLVEAILSDRKLEGAHKNEPRISMLNLSTGGCLLEAVQAIEKGKIMYLTAFLPDQDPVCDLELEIKRCERFQDKFRVGAAFIDDQSPVYEQIKGYINLLETFRVRA